MDFLRGNLQRLVKVFEATSGVSITELEVQLRA